jgi:hypothetical protein
MRRFVPLLACLLLLGCGRTQAGQAPAVGTAPAAIEASASPHVGDASGGADVDTRFTIGEPVRFGAVALFPIVDRQVPDRPKGDFHLLPEALEAKTFTVSEQTSGGSVPSLKVTNSGTKPVLLVAGDVVQGGKQDRIIVADVVVPVGADGFDIEVNCVEHGRWQQGVTGVAFGYGGRGEAALKKVVQTGKSQSKTWKAVAALNAGKARATHAAAELSPSTGTYMASLRSDKVNEWVEPAVTALVAGLKTRKEVVGVVLAVDGELVSAEMFGHPSLFAKSRDDLVRSFVLDAVSRDAKEDAKPPAVALAASFLRDAMTGERVTEEPAGAAVKAEREGERSRGFELTDKDGTLIHLNVYAETAEERAEQDLEQRNGSLRNRQMRQQRVIR